MAGLKFADHVLLITRPREADKPLQRANAFVIRQTTHSPIGLDRKPRLGTDKKPLPVEPHLDVFMVDPAHGEQGDPKHNHVESFVKPFFEVRKWTGDPAQTVGYELPAESTTAVELKKAQARADGLQSDLEAAEESHKGDLATKDQELAEAKKTADEALAAAATANAALEAEVKELKTQLAAAATPAGADPEPEKAGESA
jgi:hypothetical protein